MSPTKHRFISPPDHPRFTTHSGPRSREESRYISYNARRVLSSLETLPYGEYVEISAFAVNTSRLPRGSYNNSGSQRLSERNYGSYNDITCVRDRIRRGWKYTHPDETLHISWPEDDQGTRSVILNQDNRTVKIRVIRCEDKGCRKRTHEGML